MTASPRLLPTAHFDNASQPYLRELGRLVIAASRLDALCAVLDEFTSSDDDELTAWMTGAHSLLDGRTRLFAAAASGHFTGASSDAVRVVMPDDTVVAADAEYVERMIQRIHRHDASGQLLHLRLDVPAESASPDPIELRPEAPSHAAANREASG
ncbi:hypothetical protein BH11ACT3_BH11ACT3_08240 [soil metagenome]